MRQTFTEVIFSLILVLLTYIILSFNPVDYVQADYIVPGVYIHENGAVSGTDKIRSDGEVYTFVGNVTGPLHVKKDNIVIDGAGYTLIGSAARGIILAGRRNVTVENLRVTLDGGYVVDLENAEGCTLSGNTLLGTPQPIPGLPPPTTPLLGPITINFLHSRNIVVKGNLIKNFSTALALDFSSGHIITGNTLVDGFAGIELCNTTGCVFRDNELVNCDFYVTVYPLYQYENDLDSSNSIDGKPIYYLIDAKDKTVPADAAYIVLIRCKNIKIENTSPRGIVLISTTNSTIKRVEVTGRSSGINLLNCSNLNIIQNVLRDCAIGISLENSFNNIIISNELSNTGTRGICLSNTSKNLISSNIFTANSYAIGPFQDMPSHGDIIVSNKFAGNEFAITVTGSMNITGNIFEENEVAIAFAGGSGSTITQNMFTHNKVALYISGSSNNIIYLNNFLDNERQVVDPGVNSTQIQPLNANYGNEVSIRLLVAQNSPVNFLPPPPPSINQWDNGAKGNYWKDYNGSDYNGDGIGDTPYRLYENNQDNYPLMNPVEAPEIPPVMETSEPAPSNQPSDSSESPNALTIVLGVISIGTAFAGATIYLKRKKSANKINVH